jgi:hypothetical protein
MMVIDCCNANPALPDFKDDPKFPPDPQELTLPEWFITRHP